MEHTGLDVVVDGLFADIELWVRLEDLVRGEPLVQEGPMMSAMDFVSAEVRLTPAQESCRISW